MRNPGLAAVLEFGRRLRNMDVPVSTPRLIAFLEGLDAVQIDNMEGVKQVAYATLASDPGHLGIIDALLDRPFEDQMGRSPASGQMGDSGETDAWNEGDDIAGSERTQEAKGQQPSHSPAESFPDHNKDGRALTYSAIEVLRRKDFATCSNDELQQVARFLRLIEWRPPLRRSRRHDSFAHGKQIDVRKALRLTLKRQGDMLELPRRRRRFKERRIVLVCDVSGSMEPYTRMLLNFAHTLSRRHSHVEVFLFGTRLQRVTRLLDSRDPDTALAAIASAVKYWAGGTRIGESLADFNRTWARQVSAHGSVIMLISDGWDRGSPEVLAAELQRLQRLSHRLIWLNPLLGSSSYEPITRGMRSALPFVDDFLPIHNILSLQKLALSLNKIDTRRKPRRVVAREF